LLQRQGEFALWGGYGLHPWAIDPERDFESQKGELESGWQDYASAWGPRLKAIGEFGIDRSQRMAQVPLQLQRDLFVWHLQRARKAGLPVILHLVRANGEAVTLLEKSAPWQGVIHAFSSHHEMVRVYAALGLSFSYGSALLHSEKVRHSLRATPHERMMFETDAPDGLKGGFAPPLGPAYLLEIVRAASQVLGKSVEYLLARHRENCERVFRLEHA
jgi:TatD DNase family protein